MIADWLPGFCTRFRIFISYASEDGQLAQGLAQQLTNGGHTVFFDKDSLPPGGDYNERIRQAIGSADRLIFLASRNALTPGRFTLTELEFAKQRWPAPKDRVLPVMIDPALSSSELPVYLRSVHVMTIHGNATAEIAARMQKVRRLNSLCLSCTAVSAAAVLISAAAFFVAPAPARPVAKDIVLVGPDIVLFRPLGKPPENPSLADAPTGWVDSPLTVVAKVSYRHNRAGASAASLEAEEIVVEIGPISRRFNAINAVEIVNERGCGDDWLCRRGNFNAEQLPAGAMSKVRETLYSPADSTEQVTWRQFIDLVLAADGPNTARVVIKPRLSGLAEQQGKSVVLEFACSVDIAAFRSALSNLGFSSGHNPRPTFFGPDCTRP